MTNSEFTAQVVRDLQHELSPVIDRESPLYLRLKVCDICGHKRCRCSDDVDGDEYEERLIEENE